MSKRFLHLLPDLSWKVVLRRPTAWPKELTQQGTFYYTRNAIRLSLPQLGLQVGDEILVPAYNSRSEVQALTDYGLKLNYYDTKQNCQINIASLKSLITSKTKALYIIHYFGLAQPLPELINFCKEHNLLLLEDCALALFSKLDSQPLGSFGAAGYYCYRKYLEIPNGGSIVLNNNYKRENKWQLKSTSLVSTLVELFGLVSKNFFKNIFLQKIHRFLKTTVRFTLQNIKTDSGVPDFDADKIYWRMSGISNWLVKRLNINEIIKSRVKNYFYLKSLLDPVVASSDNLDFLDIDEQLGFAPFCLPLVVDDNLKWQQALAKQNIETGAWWRHDPFFKDSDKFPNNTWLRSHILEIPIHQSLSVKDLNNLALNIKNFVTKNNL